MAQVIITVSASEVCQGLTGMECVDANGEHNPMDERVDDTD